MDGPYRRAGVSDGLDAQLTLEENLRRIAGVPLAYAPGTGWRYSVALDVLGAAMQASAGNGLAELVRQEVTDPLDMRDTGFRVIDAGRLVTPYQDGNPQPVRMPAVAEVPYAQASIRFRLDNATTQSGYPSAGAGMSGTALDFMRFLLSFRANSPHRLLNQETIVAMMQAHVGQQAQTQGPGWGFGYGWSVLVDPLLADTPQGKGTIQWGGVYGHSWFFDPVHDIAVVALTNTAIEGMAGDFPIAVRDAVYRALKEVLPR